MSRRIFDIDVIDSDGAVLRRFSIACLAARGPALARRLLRRIPAATAVLGLEYSGRAAFSAYRTG